MKTTNIIEAPAPANVRPSSVEETREPKVTQQEVDSMVENWNDETVLQAVLKKYMKEVGSVESFACTMLVEALIRDGRARAWQIGCIAGTFTRKAAINGYNEGRAK